MRRDSPSVRDFLVANPMLTETPDGVLEAVYFHDDKRPARIDYRAESPGVERIRHAGLDDFLSGLGGCRD